MSLTTFGDSARFAAFAQDAASLKTDLRRLGTELGSGRKADLGAATGGDFSALADIRRGLRLSDAFAQGLAEAGLIAKGRQAALDRLGAEIEGAGPALLAVAGTGRSSELSLRLADAPARFAQAVETVNTRVAGQSLFSGDAPDRAALADADAILAQLRPIVAAAPDAATAVADIDAWFQNPGGGFETLAWQGGNGDPAPVYLGEGRTIDAGATAREPGIRTVLAGMAIAALAAEGSVPAPAGARHDMAAAAASRMMQGETALVDLKARIGAAEGRIETARVQTEATRASLELEESRVTAADPYATATDIETVTRQLESLYLLTARISELTLMDYLR
jgi:flagellar hook-associated protein 3 FlgL